MYLLKNFVENKIGCDPKDEFVKRFMKIVNEMKGDKINQDYKKTKLNELRLELAAICFEKPIYHDLSYGKTC